MRLVICFILGSLLLSSAANGGEITGKVNDKKAKYRRNVVVYVEKVEAEFDPPKEPSTMDQKDMAFNPHVLPILVGTTVEFLNSDSVNHNVFSPDDTADRVNLGTWGKGGKKSYTFEKEGVASVLCNVHPEMLGYIVVLQNPYFSVTDGDGSFTIENVPAGTYTLKLWREKGKDYTQSVTVPDEGIASVEFGKSKSD